MVPRLLPDRLVPTANTLSSSTQSLGVIIGPVVAGYAIGHFDLKWTYLAEAVLLVAAIGPLLGIPAMPPAKEVSGDRIFRRSIKDVWEGFGYLRTQRVL